MTYYDQQFKKLSGATYAEIKIIGENEESKCGETHWMRITPEEIVQILEILNKKESNYNF